MENRQKKNERQSSMALMAAVGTQTVLFFQSYSSPVSPLSLQTSLLLKQTGNPSYITLLFFLSGAILNV